jgi:DNA-binding SARP family transcriptional activator
MPGEDERLHIRLLGGFEIRHGERTIIDRRWSRRKAAALVKLLALQPRPAMHREQVIATLWPDKSADAGGNNLHKTAHHLRAALAAAGVSDNMISLDRNTVALARVTVDIDAFTRAAQQALASKIDIARYEQALALYTGPLLPDDVYEEWTESHREELASAARRLRLELGRLYEGVGRADDAIAVLAAAFADDPSDEDAALALVRLYASVGDRWKAIRTYVQLAHELELIGAEPAVSLDALLDDVAAHAAAKAPPLPQVQYAARSDGSRIAYTMFGVETGVPCVLLPMSPWSDLQAAWEIPEFRRWQQLLARRRPVVTFDVCGLGLSRGPQPDMSNEGHVLDLESVVDRSLALPKFDVFCPSNSVAQVAQYAGRHPGRVRRIVYWVPWLNGAVFADGLEAAGLTNMLRSAPKLYFEATGAAVVGSANSRLIAQHVAFLSLTPAETILSAIEVYRRTDVIPMLEHLQQRSLVLAPVDSAASTVVGVQIRLMLDRLPNARLIELPDQQYHWIAGDLEALVATIDAFLDAPDGHEFDYVPGLEQVNTWKPRRSMTRCFIHSTRTEFGVA